LKLASQPKGNETLFPHILGNIIDEWLTNPVGSPSLTHLLTPFLCFKFYPPVYVELINHAVAEQTEIGWLNMSYQFLSEKWH